MADIAETNHAMNDDYYFDSNFPNAKLRPYNDYKNMSTLNTYCGILSTCHITKMLISCLLKSIVSLMDLKVIFSKSNKLWLKKKLEKNGVINRSSQSTEATFNQTNFWCIYSHFCEMKSYFSYLIWSFICKGWPFIHWNALHEDA
jgi:hypothetical protein